MKKEDKPLDENTIVQNKIFLLINILNYLSTFAQCYQMIFFPILAKYGAGLSYTQIGIIQSTGSLGWLFFSIPLSNMLKKYGIQKSFRICLILVTLTIIQNGTLEYQTFSKVFFFISALIGYTLAGILRCFFIIISLNQVELGFPGEFELKYSRFEVFAGIGILSGPLIGNLLNLIMGYALPLFTIAAINIILTFYLLKVRKQGQQTKEVFSDNKIPYKKLFSSARILTGILAGMFTQGTFIFLMPFLVNHVTAYGYGPNTFGLILGIPMIMNVVVLPIVPFITKYLRNNLTLTLALSLNIFGNTIASPFWGNVQNFAALLTGLIIIGISNPLYRVPTIPLQMDNIQMILDINTKQDLNRIASSLLTTQIGLANLVMPTLGGSLYDAFDNGSGLLIGEIIDFRKTLLIFASIQITALLSFIIFGGGCKNVTQIFRKLEINNKSNELQKDLLVINKQSFETLDQEMETN